MFLPIGDEPNLRGAPVINYILMATNVAIFLLVSLPLSSRGVDPADPAVREYLAVIGRTAGLPLRVIVDNLSAYDLFVFAHGFKPATPELIDLMTSMFLHANWMHLAGNMLFLWIFGDNVELHVGRGAYVLIYLLTGALATALFAVTSLDSHLPLVGASGAISGVLGCYFLWFPRNNVRIFVWLLFFVNVIRIPARWVLGFYLVIENLLPFVFGRGETGVAYGAHIGGFLGGMGCAVLVSRWQSREGVVRRVSRPPNGPTVIDDETMSPTLGFDEAVREGEWRRALDVYTRMPVRDRLRLREDRVIGLADWLVEAQELEAGLAVLQRFIATHPQNLYLPRAHLRAGLIHLKLDRLPAAYQHFLSVLDLNASREETDGARAGLDEVAVRMKARQRLKLDA